MGYRPTRIGLKIQIDPEAAMKELLSTFRRYHGSAKDVARVHCVSYTTLKRWITTLDKAGYDVRDKIAEIRDLGYP